MTPQTISTSLQTTSTSPAVRSPFKRALVVANPTAGRGRGGVVGLQVLEGLRRRGIAADLHVTRERSDGRARVRALKAGVDLVVAVGGDGTLREVLEGLPDHEVPVGLVPLGTANVMSRDLGLPSGVGRALDVIAAGKVVAVDVARVWSARTRRVQVDDGVPADRARARGGPVGGAPLGGTPFGGAGGQLCCLATGVGFDGMVVREVDRERRGPITRWRYALALLRVLRRYRPPRLAVEIDGVTADTRYGLVLISNVVNYAGLLQLSRERRLDDGRFEVYLFREASRRALASAVVRGLAGRLPGSACELRQARRVRVMSDTPVPYHVDGDYGGETPVEVVVGEWRYRLVTP